MRLGCIVNLSEDVERELATLRDLELEACHLACWQPSIYGPVLTRLVMEATAATGVVVSGLWAGWTGPQAWGLADMPSTLGIVPLAYRAQRIAEIVAGGRFAHSIGVGDVITHLGFIPEDPGDPLYPGLVGAVRYLLDELATVGCRLLLETGQETPVTMLRLIEDVARPNIGVNLDTANLIQYGRGNPVDALDVIGPHVRSVHAKDGHYPRTGREIGREVPLGTGRVDIARVIRGLSELGYEGPIIIEREVSGPEQVRDIIAARDLLRGILARL